MAERRDRLRALGELLRRLRKEAGLTGKDLAQRAQVAQPTISRIETGQLLPTPETVERLVAALGLDEAGRAELDALLVRLRDEVSRLKDGLAGREAANAARVRAGRRLLSFQSAVIPALLQTAEYARLALAVGRDVEKADAAKAAAARVEAQSVLFDSTREFSFLLTEGAVRTWPGPPSLMLAQLDRLATVATLSHVTLGVVPWSVQVPAFPLHGFTIYDGSVSVVESLTGDLSLSESDELTRHAETFEAFTAVAVYGDALRRLLGSVADDYRRLMSHPEK
ncbi:helix-turn-helix transcriptional regulator [Nonomuraea sp. MG754425]|uniref:helix-turn-helix domain-containing protein n=1 Tax=Nonomuraea sp. MG754425 TaxID=2570319 RepID=UPI001F1CBB60|nr:helix-turn-helix transcriptional regulator [Nonomuraea sp. MG754425]